MNLFISRSRQQQPVLQRWFCGFAAAALTALYGCLGASTAHALVVASGEFKAFGLSITTTSGTYTLSPPSVPGPPNEFQLGATASDSGGGAAAQTVIVPPGPLTPATATVPNANGSASATAGVPGPALSANSYSQSGGTSASMASGNAQWASQLSVDDPTGTTVTLDLSYSGFLHGAADPYGSFHTEGYVVVEIDGSPVVFYPDLPPLILEGGPDYAADTPFSGSLTYSFFADPGTSYTLSITVDSESDTQRVPEPGSLLLVVLGGALIGTRRRAAR